MGLYKRNRIWWFSIVHEGKRIQESLKTDKKPIAKNNFSKRLIEIEKEDKEKNLIKRMTPKEWDLNNYLKENGYETCQLSGEINNFNFIELPKTCVYFLIFNNEIKYIGQTKNLLERLGRHLQSYDKYFNKVAFIPVIEKDLKAIETYFITKLQPSLNKKCR